MTLGSFTLAVALGLVTGPVRVHAGPQISSNDAVQRLADAANDDFSRGDYVAAAVHLRQALELEPDNPPLLYGLAQVLRGLDRCDEAVVLYERFLATQPPEHQRDEATAALAKCGVSVPTPELEPEPEPQPAGPGVPPGKSQERSSTSDAPVERPPVAVRWGRALTGVGGGMVGVGSIMVGVAYGLGRRARSAPTQQQFLEQSTRARGLVAAGWVTVGVGVGALVTGAVRWATARRRPRRRAAIRRHAMAVHRPEACRGCDIVGSDRRP
ncbi:MAG: tetratricopeptide repeat protein [Myxococcota bacterium]